MTFTRPQQSIWHHDLCHIGDGENACNLYFLEGTADLIYDPSHELLH